MERSPFHQPLRPDTAEYGRSSACSWRIWRWKCSGVATELVMAFARMPTGEVDGRETGGVCTALKELSAAWELAREAGLVAMPPSWPGGGGRRVGSGSDSGRDCRERVRRLRRTALRAWPRGV